MTTNLDCTSTFSKLVILSCIKRNPADVGRKVGVAVVGIGVGSPALMVGYGVDGVAVGVNVGDGVGSLVGAAVGIEEGIPLGARVGCTVGRTVGRVLGIKEGFEDGMILG